MSLLITRSTGKIEQSDEVVPQTVSHFKNMNNNCGSNSGSSSNNHSNGKDEAFDANGFHLGESSGHSGSFNHLNNNSSNNKQCMNRICRDFVRGLCRRKYCRYPHVQSPDLVVFCHDFQNSYCPRINCRFLHYSIEEEEHYRKYGEFPFIDDNNSAILQQQPPPPQDRFNRDFRYNNGNNGRQRDNESMQNGPLPPPNNYRGNFNDHHYMNSRDFRRDREDFVTLKRSNNNERYGEGAFKRFRNNDDNDTPDIMAIIRKFEEEQAMLRRRVEANEIKIAELRASNEYLMSQNAQLRLNTQVSRVVSMSTTTTPQQAAQAQPTQVINAVSMAPVQVATPIVSMATPQQSALIASTGPPQLAIAAASTTQTQQLAIAQPNISTLNTSTQQLAPINQITLTPTLTPGPTMGIATINTSQALAMSNATQPVLSYPIMTHSILPH